ncbi:MAG: hypothetical protein K2L94_05255 [Alphaproteobacteria bacterium]|nr:hypothetical protein [Alphaproteobacteria bacterium]
MFMLKAKIYLTIFTLYEIVAVLLLHCTRTCDAMFGTTFCNDHVLKYFIWCVAVPALVFLLAMWIHEIFVARRHRHSLMYKTKEAIKDMASNFGDRVGSRATPQDIEKLITAAVLVGAKKYIDRHPQARSTIENILGALGTQASDYLGDAPESDTTGRATKSRGTGGTRKKK